MKWDTDYWIIYIISNVAGILFLWASIQTPRLARLMIAILFAWASWANYSISHENPTAYLEYADGSISWYSNFINGWFKGHITIMVSIIAICQGFIATGMLLKGWWVRIACIGVIIFLIAIAPLGLYAGFPFSITVSFAACFILKRDSLNYLWKFKHRNKVVWE